MKTFLTKLFIFSLLIVSAVSCTKKDDPLPTQVVNLDTKGVHDITAISAVVDAKAKANCTERGVCWGKAPNPTLDDFHIANGSGKGEYSCTLTDLEPNQKYYYRAYAADGERIAYALDEKSFTTKDGIIHLTTGYVTDITAISATCSGNITDDGACPVIERGICFGTSPNPTLEDARHIAAGSGTGEFSVELADLTPDTTYYVRAYATSNLGTTYADDEKDFVTRDGIPVVATSDICDITATSATCGGNITADGNCPVIERGICFGTSPNPTFENNASHETLGDGLGEFSTTLTGLTPDMTYYVRAYAINSLGTTYAQDEKSFTTDDGLPSVTIDDVGEITMTSTKCNGNVADDGGFAITECGFCWSTAPNPTFDNNAQNIVAGSGTGEFSVTLTDLIPNTTYYIRAYAINSQGTVYTQDEKSFTTKDGIVKVTTNKMSEITMTSIKCNGNVTDDGGSAVTERGFCWSTFTNPMLETSESEAIGSGTGEFSFTLTGLIENTTYHICAYATNSFGGTRYGDEIVINTLTHPISFTVNGVSFEMMLVEGGTFVMGAQNDDPNGQNYLSFASNNEKPIHNVTLNDFYMSKYEVTQALWRAVMGSNMEWTFGAGNNYPAYYVSWFDCQNFITKLNQQCASQLNGKTFALPTEAEWEYAARGGKNNQGCIYSGSDNPDDVAWYNLWNENSITHPVGTKLPNELGIYDMSGNVKNWCQDWYGSYSSDSQTNPTGPSSGTYRVHRGGDAMSFGGAWGYVSRRSAYIEPNDRSKLMGFHIVLR